MILRAAVVGIGLIASPVIACAEPIVVLPAPPTLSFLPSPVGDWTVTVGIGGGVEPSYPGAGSSRVVPVPYFSVRRAGTPRRFKGIRDGASLAILDNGAGFRAGPVGKYVESRKATDHRELTGLNDIDFAIELGGFAEYYAVDWLRARVEVRRGVIGHQGIVADFSADAIVPLSQRLIFAAGPRYTVTDNTFANTYFGITGAEATLSGLAAFNAGGSQAAGAGAQLRYLLDPQWELRGYVEYERLLGSAADSPLVTLRGSKNQTRAGLGISYSFDVGLR